MSLHPLSSCSIPETTRQVARAALPQGCLCLHLVDALGPLFQDQQFASLFAPTLGRPAESPARLALVLVLQFAENLSDRQAADAVRSRIDWKYALALELTDPGFDASVLCEFRQRLIDGCLERLLLDTLLERLQAIGALQPRGRQRTDSTHVLARVRRLNRLEKAGETLRATLNALATVAPDWVRQQAAPDWFDRYGRRLENYRLPRAEAERKQWGLQVARDGQQLLAALAQESTPAWLREVPAVLVLRRVWQEQFQEQDGHLDWRKTGDIEGGSVASPYDPEACYSAKRSVDWVGYKVHLTETCDADSPHLPHLITDVETTSAITPDDVMLGPVQESLAARQLLPAEQLADKGYVNGGSLAASEERGIELIGPVASSPGWQARQDTGFDKSQFRVDWERQVMTCPAGQESVVWRPLKVAGRQEAWEVRFSPQDCGPCVHRAACTQSKARQREFRLLPQAEHAALERRREEQTSEEFWQRYSARAGIEATHEQAMRRAGLRDCRYVGLAKAHLQHVLTAVAINCCRIADWWEGHQPAPTRQSAFARLRPQEALAS